MKRLDLPDQGDVHSWVQAQLGHLALGEWRSSPIRGGQAAADAAMAAFDVAGYASRRNEVWPEDRRGASRLSPYIRHGLITLPQAWHHVAGGPARDVEKFRDELLWQEYARHLYARLGRATRRSLRYSVAEHGTEGRANPWAVEAACLSLAWRELRDSGWLPNQTRMWLASHWSVREGRGWREGEDAFFRRLLDGSRAANRLGWQWTVGALTGKPYGFSRWQVEKRAPGLCSTCPLVGQCPIEAWPPDDAPDPRITVDPRVRRDPEVAATAGPSQPQVDGAAEAVWITAESLGDDDPALRAHPELPAVFVLDEPLLASLRLAGTRLEFLTECLVDLAARRDLEVWLGEPTRVLEGRRLAATFTPVPGWHDRARQLTIEALHPWPWLRRPEAGPVTSFTAWVRSTAGSRARGARG